MLKIGIIIGSTRPARVGDQVGRWVKELADKRSDAAFDLIDLKEINLPFFDEAFPPAAGQYQNPHTLAWAKKIAQYDGFIFVTPEYNHSFPASLKNALDYLFLEWNDKAAGIVSYGSVGGARAAEQLRLVFANLRLADVQSQVMLSMFTDFENWSAFKPDPRHEPELTGLLDEVIAWSGALKSLRK